MNVHDLDVALKRLALRARQQQQQAGHLARAARSLMAAERYAAAADLYREALAVKPSDAGFHQGLALALERSGEPEAAFAHLLEALRADADDIASHRRIGQVLASGHGDEQVYLGVVWPERKPADAAEPASPRLRGHLHIARQQNDEAIDAYRTAVEEGDAAARPSLVAALRLVGHTHEAWEAEAQACLARGDAEAAVDAYRAALRGGRTTLALWLGLAQALSACHRYDEAIDACRAGLRAHPHAPDLERLWLSLLLSDGRADEALHRATAFAAQGSEHGYLDRVRHLTLPVLYADEAEATRARARYAAGLDALDASVRVEDGADVARWAGLLGAPNFFLAYQGQDDRSLQEQYGRIVQRVTADLHAGFLSLARPLTDRKLRIGYASPFWNGHTVAKLFMGWIMHHDPDRFEAIGYHLGTRSDLYTDQVRARATAFRTLRAESFQDRLAEAAEQIRADGLDVLVYPSVGMHPLPLALASLRLAPVQAVAWGHPVTTGLDTVDYFLSSEAMEPDGAEVHYSERLVRLPGLGVSVARSAPPTTTHTRAHFGLSADAVVFHSPQSLYKYHPQYDRLYPEIARRVPGAVFAFVRNRSAHVTRRFVARLESAFEAAGLDPVRHLVVLPRLSTDEFLALNRLADVYLDSPGWSGGMTSLEALAGGLPAVTWPGPFMRGRHTYAFLRTLDLPELIAADLDDYVAIAARLGNGADERAALRTTILERVDRLYDDVRPVRALEAFYEQAVAELQKGGSA